MYCHTQRGFTLVEALIAVLVLSIGLLGVAAMQLRALQSAHMGYQRSVVSLAAVDAQERAWAGLAQSPATARACPQASTMIADWRSQWFGVGKIIADDNNQSFFHDVSSCEYRVSIEWQEERYSSGESGVLSLPVQIARAMRGGRSMFLSVGVKSASRQAGFTLVELMVALVIGLIIILGAGQLFLMGFQTFRQTELLSNKQAALTFATETLIRDLRRADDIQFDSSSRQMRVEFPNDNDMSSCSPGVRIIRIYRLSNTAVSASEGRSLMLGQGCNIVPSSGAFEPLVTSFVENGFNATPIGNGAWEIQFDLMASRDANVTDSFLFMAVNRSQALNVP